MSTNSSRSGKRTLNSNNSNNNNKKKKTNQKTLGVAWGANSRSSSCSSFNNSPFSDFGSYMAVKNRKLQEQFDAEASSSLTVCSDSGKPIFHGVSIFVDGFTVPSSQELRSYMLKHGGRFENYFSRHHVTHIICSNLPDSKIKNLRSFSRGLPVVKPTWVLDSVAAKKLLSWGPYQIDQLAHQSCSQQKLSAFFALKSKSVYQDATNGASYHEIPEIEESTLKSGICKDAVSTEVSIDGSTEVGPSSSHEKSFCEVNTSSTSKVDIECGNDNVVNSARPRQPSGGSYCSDNKDSPRLTITESSHQRHSTLEDPNFVENYFKSSRLHFIGTWRNRYRKRFSNLYKGVKAKSSDVSSSSARKTAVIHVDMDCFFVSVVIRNHPELRDKPVAVCHSDNARGTAEISSANYPARDNGVKAGLFVRDAKALCPQLVIFPYDFEAYEEVADQLYNILHKHCNNVQAISCDEAFLEVTEDDPEILASVLREEIFETTRCTASAGIAGNMLMARLATRTAKPDGQCYIPTEKVDDYLYKLPIKALPGIGYVLEEKLRKLEVQTCGQLRMISKETLQKDFGTKTGDMLWNYSRGIDNRMVGVIQESKSVGAEVNWGVRFKDLKDTQHFLTNLCKEVSLRLQGCGVQGRTFTMKIKKRRKDAGEPAKYMGCGDCENLSHSMTVPVATDDVEVLQRISKQLFGVFHIDVKEIRGVGLQVSKLESADTTKQGSGKKSLQSWLATASSSGEQLSFNSQSKTRTTRDCEKQRNDGVSAQFCNESILLTHQNSLDSGARLNQALELPPLCKLDMGVIDSLPPELFSEINEMYAGKLADFITKCRVDSGSILNSTRAPLYEVEGELVEGGSASSSRSASLNKFSIQDERKVQEAPISLSGSSNVLVPSLHLDKTELMPSSLSQIDKSVLQELPDELRVGILEVLPAHRTGCATNPTPVPVKEDAQVPSVVIVVESSLGLEGSISNENLWFGNPPRWVDKFKCSNCSILRLFAEMYYRKGMSGCLSAILQGFISGYRQLVDENSEGQDELVYTLCELFKQYINIKIERDLEEIYFCFRLFKRCAMKPSFLLQVYNIVISYLQASVGEVYGGNLNLSG